MIVGDDDSDFISLHSLPFLCFRIRPCIRPRMRPLLRQRIQLDLPRLYHLPFCHGRSKQILIHAGGEMPATEIDEFGERRGTRLLCTFEVVLGLWLLIRGIRAPIVE